MTTWGRKLRAASRASSPLYAAIARWPLALTMRARLSATECSSSTISTRRLAERTGWLPSPVGAVINESITCAAPARTRDFQGRRVHLIRNWVSKRNFRAAPFAFSSVALNSTYKRGILRMRRVCSPGFFTVRAPAGGEMSGLKAHFLFAANSGWASIMKGRILNGLGANDSKA